MAASGYILSARAAEKIRALASPRGASAGASHAQGGAAFANRTPPPFTVRWASEANNGNGAWIIYRPKVVVQRSELTDEGLFAAAGDPYPAGWGMYEVAQTGNREIMLYVYADKFLIVGWRINNPTDCLAEVKIADVSRDATTGAVSITQYLVGSLVLGAGGGSSLSGSLDFIGAVRYDNSGTSPSYDLQYRTDTYNFATGAIVEGDWTTFAETIAHTVEMDGGTSGGSSS